MPQKTPPPHPRAHTCVCASTRMVVQCFFICASSASMAFLPSAYLATYLVNAFFLALYLMVWWW